MARSRRCGRASGCSAAPLSRRSGAPTGSPTGRDPGRDTGLRRVGRRARRDLAGHATTLLELDGARFLLDPVFGERTSPLKRRGPRRLHPVPALVEDLPPLDAVVISHDHYDHLDHRDHESIVRLERSQQPRFVVPLGVDLHLRAWGVPADRITALDWRETTTVGELRVTCTEARHNSGRSLADSHTLWAGAGAADDVMPGDHRIDTPGGGHEEGERTAFARTTHTVAGRSVLLRVHWGTFNLAKHWWSEPIRRTLCTAAAADVPVIAPRPGDRVDLAGRDPRGARRSLHGALVGGGSGSRGPGLRASWHPADCRGYRDA